MSQIEKKEKMNAVRITTTMDFDQYVEMKKNKWKPSELLKKGFICMVKPDVLQEQIDALKAEVEAQRRKITSQRRLIPSIVAKL